MSVSVSGSTPVPPFKKNKQLESFLKQKEAERQKMNLEDLEDLEEKQIPFQDYRILRNRTPYVLLLLLALVFLNLTMASMNVFKAAIIMGEEALNQNNYENPITPKEAEGIRRLDPDVNSKIILAQIKIFQGIQWIDRLKFHLMYLAASWLMFAIVIYMRNINSDKNCIVGYILIGTYAAYLISAISIMGKGFIMEDFIRSMIIAIMNYDKTLESLARARAELAKYEMEAGHEPQVNNFDYA